MPPAHHPRPGVTLGELATGVRRAADLFGERVAALPDAHVSYVPRRS